MILICVLINKAQELVPMTQFNPDHQVQLLDARFEDVEQLCAVVQAWDLDFKLLSGKQRSAQNLRLQQFVAGGIDHGYARFSAVINQTGAPPPDKLTFTVLGKNLGQLWWRGHHVEAGSVLVFPRNSELHSVSGRDFETDVLSVDDDTLAAICQRNELPVPDTSALGQVFRPSRHVLNRLRARLHGIRTTDKPAGIADYVGVLEELVTEWARVSGSATSGNIRGLRNRDRAMRLCLDAITERDLDNLNAADLCDLAGVSTRTLEYAFRERFNLGPAAFLKSRRMLAVRKALREAEPDQPGVGEMAAQFRFWHSGQFARDYKTRFNEAPSATLARTAH